jgi:ribosomal protein S27AE
VVKVCIDCGEHKPPEEFYAHPQMADGHLNVCKACHKARMKRRRLTNPYVQECDRIRSRTPERKRHGIENARRWNMKHPDAYKAHYTLTNAVRDGKLKREPCAICGAEQVHAHHKDYSRPLDVIWLCAKCHHRIHATFPELGGHFD